MSQPWVIYVLLDPTQTPFYVGASRNFPRRLREHKKTLGYKPSHAILETGTGNRSQAEHRWIELYRKEGYKLFNKTAGGNGCQTASSDTRALLSHISKGKKKPPGFGDKISRASKGQSRNWTPEGEMRVRQTQFKKGHDEWSSLAVEEKKRRIAKSWQTRKSDPQKCKAHSKKITDLNNKVWAARTPEQRSALGKKIAEARLKNHTPEELFAIASKRGKAVAAKPGARERLSNQIKTWWASLTPEAKQEYVTRRTARIREAKAKKGND